MTENPKIQGHQPIWPTPPPEFDQPESLDAPGPEAARHFRPLPDDPTQGTPEEIAKLPAGAVLRLADGQFGQLYYLWDGPTATPFTAVLLFGVAEPQLLQPSDFPVELVTKNQYRGGVVLDEVSDPAVSAALDNALKTRT